VLEPSIHRVCTPGKPKFQLRQGEEGLSAFDAVKVTTSDIFPWFRPGSVTVTVEVARVESFGLQVVRTPGDLELPELLRENHVEIRPGDGMSRKAFKAALQALEQATGGEP
jgi:hypothetical protein